MPEVRTLLGKAVNLVPSYLNVQSIQNQNEGSRGIVLSTLEVELVLELHGLLE